MSFKEWLELREAAFDHPNAFKAVFMAGGPGSGKTWVAHSMFAGTDFQMANSDSVMALLARKMGDSNVIKATAGHPEYSRKQQLQSKAMNLSQKRTALWQQEGIPFVIDITGRDLSLVQTLKNKLESRGYDTYMVFVNTSLETALQRNRRRFYEPDKHVADEDFLQFAWEQSNNNIDAFRRLFGPGNFLLVSNDQDLRDRSEQSKFTLSLYRVGRNLVSKPVQNPIGQEILGRQSLAAV